MREPVLYKSYGILKMAFWKLMPIFRVSTWIQTRNKKQARAVAGALRLMQWHCRAKKIWCVSISASLGLLAETDRKGPKISDALGEILHQFSLVRGWTERLTINFLNFSSENPFRGWESAKTPTEQTFSLAPLMGTAFGAMLKFRRSKIYDGYFFDRRKLSIAPNAAPLNGAWENFYPMGVLADSEPANGFSGVNFIFLFDRNFVFDLFFRF